MTDAYDPLNDFDIQSLTIHPRTGNQYDIKNLLVEMNIYSSLYEQTMSANLTIIDAINMVGTLPIVGGEIVRITFKTAGFTEYITLSFRVGEIGERVMQQKTTGFILHLISESRYQDTQKRFSRGFRDTYSKIIQAAHGHYTSVPFMDEIEESAGVVTMATPNWSPLSVIAWCIKRAVTDQKSPLMYWEDIDGFRLRSLDHLVQEEPKRRYYYKQEGTTDEVERLLSNIIDMQYLPSRDVETSRYKGVYNHLENVYRFDTKSMQINKKEYSAWFSESKHLETYPVHVDPVEDLNSECYVWQLYRDDDSHSYRHSRACVANTLSNVRMNLLLPGNYKTRVGDVVEYNPPSPQASPNGEFREEPYLSGKFMITAVRHIIRPENHSLMVELTKDSYNKDIGGPDYAE